jgi:hypothetical protein
MPMFCMFWMFQLFLIGEFYAVLFMDQISITLTFKTIIGLLGVAIATIAYDSHKTNLNRSIQFALMLLMCADVITRINVMTGAVLHVLSYMYLTYVFIREEKPVPSQITIWGFLCVVAAIAVYMQPANPFGSKFYILLYVCAALAMACASFPMPKRCLSASILLFLAGILDQRDPSLRHAQPCQQFFDRKRFCQIIIRSCVERVDLVSIFTSGADHDDRNI